MSNKPHPQKHEREALALARDLLGPGVSFERQRKCGLLVHGPHQLKVAVNSGSGGTDQQVRRWARQIRGQ